MRTRTSTNTTFPNFVMVLAFGFVSACVDAECPIGTMLVSGRCVETIASGVEMAPDGGPVNSSTGAIAGTGAGIGGALPAAMGTGGAAVGISQPAGSGAAAAGSPSAASMAGALAFPPSGGGAPGPAPVQEACTAEGTMRCGTSEPNLREKCSGAVWVPVGACASGETCASDGSCQPVSALCRGNAGAAVCDAQGALLLCNPDYTAMPLETCTSPALCRAGIPSKACATCVPNEHKCTGVTLDVCAPDGMGFMRQENCDTPGLCNAMLGRCTTAVCDPNKKSCMGDTLVTCNADGTALTNATVECESGMCDAVGGDCNMCVPGEKSCNGSNAQTCDATGQRYTPTPCSGGHCIGPGMCVACTQDSDCSSSVPCKAAYCTTDNRCSTRNAADHASCATGVCQSGSCVGCINNSDCGTQPANTCEDGNCVEPCKIPPQSTYMTSCNWCDFNQTTCTITCTECATDYPPMNYRRTNVTWNLKDMPCDTGIANCGDRLICSGSLCPWDQPQP